MLEALVAAALLSNFVGSGVYLFKTLADFGQRISHQLLAANLAAYQAEKILGTNFENVVSFKTAENPTDDWAQAVSEARLPEGAGEVAVTEINQNLKEVTVSVAYQNGKKNEKFILETMVAR